MPNRKSKKKSLAQFKRRFHRQTGFSFDHLIKGFAFLLIVLVGIGLTVFYTNAEQANKVSGIEGVEAKRLTDGEQFVAVSELPNDFPSKIPVEKIDILESKIAIGEKLVSAEGQYVQRAVDQLVFLYGALCQLQESEGIDSNKSYQRMAELRQQAIEEGNQRRVAVADYLCAISATKRLKRSSEQADFRFAADFILKLDSKNMVQAEEIKKLYVEAIELHDTSSQQANTAILLSTLGDKLIDSDEREVSNIGLRLKDHARYAPYYAAIDALPYTTRETKLDFFRKLLEEIEKAPPQSLQTYQVVFQLVDRLTNKSDAFFSGTLTKRLKKATSKVDERIKEQVDYSIKKAETRIAWLGKTADLSGSDFNGSPLQLPNGKPTTLVFWRFGDMKSMEYLKSTANSSLLNPWETNLLVACLSQQATEEFEELGQKLGRFTVLDYPTSRRLGDEFAVEFIPYQVSMDKDGKVVRLGQPRD